MNYRTFIVCLLLVLPVQLDKITKGASWGVVEISVAFLVAILIAFFWTFVAGWMRGKFAPNLSDSYVAKIQVVFALSGILLIVNVFFNHKEDSQIKKLSTLEEASIIADLVISLQSDCKRITAGAGNACETITDKFVDCIGGYRKPNEEFKSILQICREKITKDFGG